MSEIPKRLAPRLETFRELCLKSGNLCAYPGCGALMMNEEGLFIGQLYHIEAAEPDGERFNPEMTNEQRRSAANLMLMCYPHHRETNNVAKYSVADLKKMKAAHERRFSRPDRATRERVARLNWAALVGAGVVAGMSIGGIVQQIRSALDVLMRPAREPEAEPRPLRKELLNILRLAPRGTVHCYSRDPLHLAVAEAFIELFQESGWYIDRLQKPLPFKGGNDPDFDNSALMLFAVRDPHQKPIAKIAIEEFFDMSGFKRGPDPDITTDVEGGRIIRLYIPIGVKLP